MSVSSPPLGVRPAGGDPLSVPHAAVLRQTFCVSSPTRSPRRSEPRRADVVLLVVEVVVLVVMSFGGSFAAGAWEPNGTAADLTPDAAIPYAVVSYVTLVAVTTWAVWRMSLAFMALQGCLWLLVGWLALDGHGWTALLL